MSLLYRLFRAIYRFARSCVIESVRRIGAGTIRVGGPTGLFSALDDPQELGLVRAGQELIPGPLESLRIQCGLNQQGWSSWPIFWKKFSHARLVGKSLAVLNGRKELMVESASGVTYVSSDPSYNYLYLPRATRLSGSWTSLVSSWCLGGHANYYHWLTDGLPRLALLDRFPADTRILVPAPLKAFQRDSLEILGVLDRCRPSPETHLEIESYYFSHATTMTGCDNPYAVKFLRDRFLSSAKDIPLAFEKIYVSRRASSRGADQEDRMIDFLETQGWTIIQAEKHSFREQIALFANARAICGVHGAGLTNLVWCQPGCKVLELCAANFLNGCYEGLASYTGLDYRYLVFEGDRRCRVKIDFKRFEEAIRSLTN